jgi:subtilisin family serine protease
MSAKKITDSKRYGFYVERNPLHTLVPGRAELDILKSGNGFVPMEPKITGIPSKWADTRGQGVVVAVLDTGIDETHVDLQNVVTESVDFTGEGLIDENGHGTLMAGIIAGLPNGTGIIGMAPSCKIKSVKVMGKDGRGCNADICKGLYWAIKKKVDIINLSINGYEESQELNKAIHTAIAAGIIIVCAAGNDGGLNGNLNGLPAGYGSLITIGAHDRFGKPCDFTKVGPNIDFMAAGTYIWSTYPGNSYACISGTSPAAALVTGMASLVLAYHKLNPGGRTPVENTYDMKQHLRRLSTDPGSRDMQQGHGIIKPLMYADTSITMVKDSSITVEMVKDSSITAFIPVVIDGENYVIIHYDYNRLFSQINVTLK